SNAVGICSRVRRLVSQWRWQRRGQPAAGRRDSVWTGDNHVVEWGGAEPVIGHGRCSRRRAAGARRVRSNRLVTAGAGPASRLAGVEFASIATLHGSGQLKETALVEADVLLANGADPAK